MNRLQIIRTVLAFLDRTPIDGEEAEVMVLCKSWLRKEGLASKTESGTPPPQVADTSGK